MIRSDRSSSSPNWGWRPGASSARPPRSGCYRAPRTCRPTASSPLRPTRRSSTPTSSASTPSCWRSSASGISPILAGWTPIRTFWRRTNQAIGSVDADIVDIQTWAAPSPFGSDDHQATSASSADLVVLFTTPLFREYPGTVVYLAPVPTDAEGHPDWAEPPMLDAVVFPTFQGQLAPDQVFFGFDAEPSLIADVWVVLEETVRGRRFSAGDPPVGSSGDGAARAAASVVPPRRVLIQGQRLAQGLDS